MSWKKPDISYWNNKFAAWWHDPIDKAFDIQKHESRAAAYLQIFGLDRPNDEHTLEGAASANEASRRPILENGRMGADRV